VLFVVCQTVQDAEDAVALLITEEMTDDRAAVLTITSQSSDEALAALAEVEEADGLQTVHSRPSADPSFPMAETAFYPPRVRNSTESLVSAAHLFDHVPRHPAESYCV
jgi:hypothetical protein